LFFREKESLLTTINQFQNRTGKYAIKGYPQRLGLLLTGPPGTGKTSLIKSLAQHTGRSIVNVNIARINTNAELMSVFFDRKYRVEGEWSSVKLNFKDVIFVLEDIDAASRVVHRRNGKNRNEFNQDGQAHQAAPKSLWQLMLESTDPECQRLVGLLMNKSERLKAEACKTDVAISIAKRAALFPGLGIVGEAIANDSTVLQNIGDTAIRSAERLMANLSVVNKFLSIHCKALESRLKSGTEVDDRLVDELLGMSMPSIVAHQPDEYDEGSEVSSDFTEIQGTFDFMSTAAISTDKKEGPAELDKKEAPAGTDKKEGAAGGANKIKPDKPSFWPKFNLDELNLAGILNVLDGVVDAPGRIVVMTTNHPEVLDPALIRPGRIDKKLFLGYIEVDDMLSMLEHYYQTTLTNLQRSRLADCMTGNVPEERRSQLRMTPAQVEQLTVEYESVDDLIAELESRSRSTLIPADPNARLS
jgi:SpoVK/Ycf46/Vps4 family AAA+-type ATPase